MDIQAVQGLHYLQAVNGLKVNFHLQQSTKKPLLQMKNNTILKFVKKFYSVSTRISCKFSKDLFSEHLDKVPFNRAVLRESVSVRTEYLILYMTTGQQDTCTYKTSADSILYIIGLE